MQSIQNQMGPPSDHSHRLPTIPEFSHSLEPSCSDVSLNDELDAIFDESLSAESQVPAGQYMFGLPAPLPVDMVSLASSMPTLIQFARMTPPTSVLSPRSSVFPPPETGFFSRLCGCSCQLLH